MPSREKIQASEDIGGFVVYNDYTGACLHKVLYKIL